MEIKILDNGFQIAMMITNRIAQEDFTNNETIKSLQIIRNKAELSEELTDVEVDLLEEFCFPTMY